MVHLFTQLMTSGHNILMYRYIMLTLSFFDRILEQSYYPFYLLVIIAHLLYFITFMGIYYVNVKYLHTLDVLTQTFICLFLLIRFFPFRHHQLNKYDTSIIFGSALLLASNLFVTEYSKTIIGKSIYETSNNIGVQTKKYYTTIANVNTNTNANT